MSNFELSEHQSAVVETSANALMVQAAAGSGKTRVLVELYVKRVIEQKVSPDQILCVTFTKKAAAEMKQRIVNSLRIRGCEREAQIAETGPIQTLHSFCERVLRENALDACLDPDFVILSEADSQAWMEQAMLGSISNSPQESFAADVIQSLSGKRAYNSNSDHSTLLEPIRSSLQALRGTLLAPQQVSQLHSSPEEYVRASYQAILGLQPKEVAEELAKGPDHTFWSRLRDAYGALKQAVPTWLPQKKSLDTIYGDELESAKWSCGIADLVVRSWKSLEERMFEEQAFDFSKMESLAVHQLTENVRIRDRVQRQFPLVLIDEGQDLNPIQDKMIDAIGGDFRMIVGDTKQSIYGFRQADVRLFEGRMQSTQTLDLPRNYRSEPDLLRFVDKLFSKTWPNYAPMAHPLEAAESFEGAEVWDCEGFDQVAEWVAELCDECPPSEIAVLVRYADHMSTIGHRLEALGIPVRIVGAGRNYYLRLEVRDLANMLEALSCPSNDFALLAALRSPIVGLSLTAIVKLGMGGGVAAKLSDSACFGAEDAAKLERFQKWFDPLVKQVPKLSAWQVLSEVFAYPGYWPALVRKPNGRRQLANIRKLFLIAAERPELNAQEFARLMRQLQQLKLREGDAPAIDDGVGAVTLMTVHRSKGLEFPVVVVPSTSSSISRKLRPLEIDKDFGIISLKPSGGKTGIGDWIGERRKQFEKEEELRALYVAMTRAKSRLCVVANPRKTGTLGRLIWDSLELESSKPIGLKIRRANSSEGPS